MAANPTFLALDLSTSSTGWALFDAITGTPIAYGALVPPNLPKKLATLPSAKLGRMVTLAREVGALARLHNPSRIVIEEIAGSKNRLTQKVLDGFHYLVMLELGPWLDSAHFYDVSGVDGWRTHLKLKLTEADKLNNKSAKKLNPRLPRGQKLPEITPKHLAAREVLRCLGISLDVDGNPSDNDIADALAMGFAYFRFILPKAPK